MITTRERISNFQVPTFSHARATHDWEPGFTNVDEQVGYTGSYSRIRDNNNRAARKAMANGAVILSDCEILRWSRSMSEGSYAAATIAGNWSGNVSGDLVGQVGGQPQRTTETISVGETENMLIKAFAKVYSSPIVVGESLSDVGQTLAMLRRPFKGAADLLYNMSKSRAQRLRGGKVTPASATRDAWLEYRYGWKPLLMDIEAIRKKTRENLLSLNRYRLVARAGTRREFSTDDSWPATATFSCSGSQSRLTKLRCDAGVIYDIVDRRPSDEIAAFMGSRVRDVPATVWEMIPFSFVADWFSNVGDWLQAISPDPNIKVRGWWVTTIEDVTAKKSGSISYVGEPPMPPWQGSFGSEEVHTFLYRRTCNQEVAFTPRLTRNPLSIAHQADAIALLHSITSKLKGFRH